MGLETAHLHGFRAQLVRACKLADLTTPQEFAERFRCWPLLQPLRESGATISNDGLVSDICVQASLELTSSALCTQRHWFHEHSVVPAFFAMIALAVADTATPTTFNLDLSFLNTFPPPEMPTWHDVFQNSMVNTSARVLVGELLEQHGRYADALTFAQAELQVRSTIRVVCHS